MKKLIAILVVFAIFAGTAFAQDGTWGISLSGKGIIGGVVKFDPAATTGGPVNGDAPAFSPTPNGDFNGFSLDVNYTWPEDLFKAGVTVNQGGVSTYLSASYGGIITAKITGDLANFGGDGFSILTASFVKYEIGAKDTTDVGSYDFAFNGTIGSAISKLGGKFNIYDNLLFEGSYLDYAEENRWVINTAFKDDGFGESVTKAWGKHKFFLFNYDLKDILAGLEAGIFVPGLFDNAAGNVFEDLIYGVQYKSSEFNLSLQVYNIFNHSNIGATDAAKRSNLRLQGTIFSEPTIALVDLDTIIDFDEFNLALGVKVSTGDIKFSDEAKLAAWLKFFSVDTFETIKLNAEATFTYADDPFGAGVTLGFTSTLTPDFVGSIAIKPYIQYDFDPEHLRGKLALELGIPFSGDITWSVNPTFVYNFLGGGFGDFFKKLGDSGVKMGMFLGYKVGGTFNDITTNELTAGMKWSF